MNIIITRALNMEFEEKTLLQRFFMEKDKLLYILELSYKKYYNLLYNYGLKLTNDSELVQTLSKKYSLNFVNVKISITFLI